MRTAYDSTNPYDIPTTAAIVAGYIDGIYRWSVGGWLRFPYSVHVYIAVAPVTDNGHVLDVETGDAFPWEAPGWVLMRRAAGIDPTVYVNWSNWGPTRTEFQRRGIPEPHYWLASYDGNAEVPAGCVAKQYANSTISGGHYDLSAVADYWPGVDASNPTATAGSEVRVPQEAFMTDPELVVIHHLMKGAIFGPGFDSSDQADFIAQVKNGTPLNAFYDNWYVTPQAAAWRAKQAAVGVRGPAGVIGPPGPPGPAPDTSQLAPIVHKHIVTGNAQ